MPSMPVPSPSPPCSAAASLLPAEEVATETTPVESPPETAAPASEALDPSADGPLATDLPAEPAPAVHPPRPPPTSPSTSSTASLTKDPHPAEADDMIQQAEADALAVQQAAAAQADIAALPPPPSEDEMRVTYIPEVVKNNMRDQIKQELMAAAREEKWSEKKYPEWTERFRPFGDIRVRFRGRLLLQRKRRHRRLPQLQRHQHRPALRRLPQQPQFAPQYNVNKTASASACAPAWAPTSCWATASTAASASPPATATRPPPPTRPSAASPTTPAGTSRNTPSGSTAPSSVTTPAPVDGEELTFLVGRFDNPFFSTDIHWDNDLGFDGLALRGKVRINDNVSTFFAGGYFPVYNTDFNFASNQPEKFPSTDKWLTGAQLGIDWKVAEDWKAKFAVAYYSFDRIKGRALRPLHPAQPQRRRQHRLHPPRLRPARQHLHRPARHRPRLRQRLRQLYQYQYFGLASEFENLAFTGKLDLRRLRSRHASPSSGKSPKTSPSTSTKPPPSATAARTTSIEGGDLAWYLAFQVGMPALEKFGDWQTAVGYRYVESDAVVDGFTDSDFGGGGTNVQGFTIGGSMALSPLVRIALTWMSSNEIAGPPLSQDTLQFDINAKF